MYVLNFYMYNDSHFIENQYCSFP